MKWMFPWEFLLNTFNCSELCLIVLFGIFYLLWKIKKDTLFHCTPPGWSVIWTNFPVFQCLRDLFFCFFICSTYWFLRLTFYFFLGKRKFGLENSYSQWEEKKYNTDLGKTYIADFQHVRVKHTFTWLCASKRMAGGGL